MAALQPNEEELAEAVEIPATYDEEDEEDSACCARCSRGGALMPCVQLTMTSRTRGHIRWTLVSVPF